GSLHSDHSHPRSSRYLNHWLHRNNRTCQPHHQMKQARTEHKLYSCWQERTDMDQLDRCQRCPTRLVWPAHCRAIRKHCSEPSLCDSYRNLYQWLDCSSTSRTSHRQLCKPDKMHSSCSLLDYCKDRSGKSMKQKEANQVMDSTRWCTGTSD